MGLSAVLKIFAPHIVGAVVKKLFGEKAECPDCHTKQRIKEKPIVCKECKRNGKERELKKESCCEHKKR